jgi:uncharacterized protein (DUF433 family)
VKHQQLDAIIDLEIARHRPMYLAVEAARWARTTPQTARRWVRGYEYRKPSGDRAWSPPVTQRRSDDLLTFDDLVEIAAVAGARKAGVSMPKIRQAIDFTKTELGITRPLLSETFLTDGRELFLRDAASAPNFTSLNRVGQIAWSEIEAVLREVDYEGRVAARWWPTGRDAGVVIDPLVNFGRPIIATLGVRTETLVDRFVAGVDLEDLAEEYGTSPAAVQEAVRFENRSAAIAA